MNEKLNEVFGGSREYILYADEETGLRIWKFHKKTTIFSLLDLAETVVAGSAWRPSLQMLPLTFSWRKRLRERSRA